MQLNLLDLSGKETTNKVVIEWLDISLVFPSGDNPRLSLNQEVIDGLVSVLQESGWATVSPIAVRKVANGYEVVDGHHRLESAKQAKATQVLCTVLEMTDEEAVIQRWLLNNQTEFKDIEKCLYFYKHTKKDSKLGLSRAEFAKKLNAHRNTGSLWAKAGEVIDECTIDCALLEGKTTHLSYIAQTSESYWQQLTELLIANEWSVKQTEEICKAVRDINIPEHFQQWLNPDKYIKEAIKEFEKDGKITIVESLKKWVEEGNNFLKDLDPKRKTIVVVNDEEKIVYLDGKKLYLKKLYGMLKKSTDKPSLKKIAQCSNEVLSYFRTLDIKHQKWKESKASETQRKQQLEREGLAKTKLIEMYSPRYLMGDCRQVFFEDKKGLIDLVLTDPPYLLSNGGITCRGQKQVSVDKNFEDSDENTIRPYEWLSICYDYLKDGGVLVFSCTDHIYSEAFLDAQKIGFKHLETLIWYKKSAPPRLTTTGHRACFEYIAVFKKGTASHYFAYDEIKKELGDKQPSAVLEYEQCSGNEREQGGGHDTQKPLSLWEYLVRTYSRPYDQVLDIFSGSGTTAVACKKLGRIGYWIEKKQEFFDSALTRLDNTLFHFESDKKVLEKMIDEILSTTTEE